MNEQFKTNIKSNGKEAIVMFPQIYDKHNKNMNSSGTTEVVK